MAYRIYRTAESIFLENTEAPGVFRNLAEGFSFNDLFTASDPQSYVAGLFETASEAESFAPGIPYQAPIGDQEVWAAGVTYFRSRTARMEEAETAGGDIFYDKVYDADRPELFFKATAPRTRGHLDKVAIREDSTWDVPEPELTLAVTSEGKIFGYTIGNDMSSRSIEGENPLYLPQAKVYTGSCSIGPCLVVGDSPGPDTGIQIEIRRSGETVFRGETEVSQLKRGFEELAGFLFRSNEFCHGAYLMTGTGVVPDSDFTLRAGDEIAITIDGVGTLTNQVEVV
ncbi:MAG: fumarylacetoacetate hydrolase family protein [Verrucomicrobiales bacterium]|nr:fumarylacetoacetate hydrolase family protein [Verrucomicrobiales bacterium]